MSAWLPILDKVAAGIPAAIPPIVMFWLFMRHLRMVSRDAEARLIAAAEECHAAQSRSSEATDRSTTALLQFAEAAPGMADAIRANSDSVLQLTIAVTRCQGLEPVGED